jgi:peptidase E
MTQHIIALGGGGFSMEPGNPLLDRYVLDTTGKSRPRVCFLAQATAESTPYILKFFEAMTTLGAIPSHLSLFGTPPRPDRREFLLTQDVIFVGGGNTKSLLILWRGWGVDAILREAYARGVVLAGISAGANCWFEQCITDSITPELNMMDCLGFLPGSYCPHYDGEAQRRPTFHRLVREGRVKDGIACDDGAAAHFVDGALAHVISSRPQAKGYRVVRGEDGAAVETVLETRYLG